jgi:AcrR family transcriptional regulator
MNNTNNCIEENIKKKFWEMYKNTPLSKIRVSDLIRVCNISRGTFYFHFTDVYALYHECEKDMISLLEMDLSDVVLSAVGKNYDKHVKMLGKHLTTYAENIDMLKYFLTGSEETSFRRAWFDSICRIYERAMEFSYALSSSKHAKIIRFYAGGYTTIISDWILTDCKQPVGDLASILAQVQFHGVLSQPTMKKTR